MKSSAQSTKITAARSCIHPSHSQEAKRVDDYSDLKQIRMFIFVSKTLPQYMSVYTAIQLHGIWIWMAYFTDCSCFTSVRLRGMTSMLIPSTSTLIHLCTAYYPTPLSLVSLNSYWLWPDNVCNISTTLIPTTLLFSIRCVHDTFAIFWHNILQQWTIHPPIRFPHRMHIIINYPTNIKHAVEVYNTSETN